jgi:hypothetical protein
MLLVIAGAASRRTPHHVLRGLPYGSDWGFIEAASRSLSGLCGVGWKYGPVFGLPPALVEFLER